ncbi:YgcG family protein [Methylosinus sp. Sm6]|uniref:TPM domain-containing protein n=1 Tax=Methylosinus sp. Sm6 TaxID=2866948 RepID=UPI0021058946|nr:TPM domain-containing protein [Methylosinus sp. Sm6]
MIKIAPRGSAALALLVLLPVLAFAALSFPALTGRVVDDAHILPQAAKLAVETKSRALEDKSGIQLVVATIPSLQGADIESFANGLFRFWKLGEAKTNNGVLFLIAPNERKMRIEVGYGLEGALTDALSKIIIATAVTPKFKAGDYGAGVERGVDAIVEVLSGDAAEWQKRVKLRAEGEDAFDDLVPLIMVALFLFVFLSMLSNARGGRRAYRGGRGPIVYLPPSNDSWSGGSSWGSGSSWGGGGDGGFSGGGGSSGGGGASGDW